MPSSQVNFALTSSADNPLSCRASNCAFQLGTSIAQCSSVSCSCKEACPGRYSVLGRVRKCGNSCMFRHKNRRSYGNWAGKARFLVPQTAVSQSIAPPPPASLCDAPHLGHAVDLQGVLDVIEGNPCTLSCNEVTGECTFDIQDFFVTLIAPCTNAQCIVEGYTASQGV